jgi:hypothetical protein
MADADDRVELLRPVGERRDELGDVHRAAAAEADHEIGAAGAGDLDRGGEVGAGRLAGDLAPHGRGDAEPFEVAHQRRAQLHDLRRGDSSTLVAPAPRSPRRTRPARRLPRARSAHDAG